MKILANVALIVLWMAAAGLLFAGLFPGLLSDLFFLSAITFILWGPLGLGAVIVAGYRLRSRRFRLERATQVRLLCAGLALMSSALLTALTIPRQLAFAAFRDDFEVLAQSAATTGSEGSDSKPLNRRVGLWWVSDYQVDKRGGAYFRTWMGPDGIGPDVMSFGVAWRPNDKGSPYGASGYYLTRIDKDWSWFQASDDWN